jgi:hypothetical protein
LSDQGGQNRRKILQTVYLQRRPHATEARQSSSTPIPAWAAERTVPSGTALGQKINNAAACTAAADPYLSKEVTEMMSKKAIPRGLPFFGKKQSSRLVLTQQEKSSQNNTQYHGEEN